MINLIHPYISIHLFNPTDLEGLNSSAYNYYLIIYVKNNLPLTAPQEPHIIILMILRTINGKHGII